MIGRFFTITVCWFLAVKLYGCKRLAQSCCLFLSKCGRMSSGHYFTLAWKANRSPVTGHWWYTVSRFSPQTMTSHNIATVVRIKSGTTYQIVDYPSLWGSWALQKYIFSVRCIWSQVLTPQFIYYCYLTALSLSVFSLSGGELNLFVIEHWDHTGELCGPVSARSKCPLLLAK